MKGRTFLIRFADDFVIGCEREEDARRIMAVLPKRFARFGLTMHPTQTVKGRHAKPYQVEQVRHVILKYRLGGQDGER
jgi:hypothetical protein